MKTVRYLSALMCLIFFLALPVQALEAELVIQDLQGTITAKPGSSYTAADLFPAFKNLVPGDEKSQRIVISNRCKQHKQARIFLKTVVHDNANPLSPKVSEKESIASMEDFLSQLTLEIEVEGKPVFSGSANDSIQSPIDLGKIPYRGSRELLVTLSIPAALDNTYAQRIGEVDWVFTVENRDTEGPSWIPKTSDDFSLALWNSLVLASGLLLLDIGIVLTRKKKM